MSVNSKNVFVGAPDQAVKTGQVICVISQNSA